jgi:valyl-tRNA synthetase
MVQPYPVAEEIDEAIMEEFALAIDAIVSVRRCKTLIDKANQRIDKAYVKLSRPADETMLKAFVEKLGKVDTIAFVTDKPARSVTDVGDQVETYISTAEIDTGPIITRLEKQLAKLDKEIAKLTGMLSNEKFVANAPETVIATNRTALEEAEAKRAKIAVELKNFA